jgi:hypothetical protein
VSNFVVCCVIVATGLVLLLAFLALSGGAVELTALAAVLTSGATLVTCIGAKNNKNK